MSNLGFYILNMFFTGGLIKQTHGEPHTWNMRDQRWLTHGCFAHSVKVGPSTLNPLAMCRASLFLY